MQNIVSLDGLQKTLCFWRREAPQTPDLDWGASFRAHLAGVCMVSQEELRALPPVVNGEIRSLIQYELLGLVNAVPNLDSPKFDNVKLEVARQLALKRGFAALARHCNLLIERMSSNADMHGALRVGESLRGSIDAAAREANTLLGLVAQLEAEMPASTTPLILACIGAIGPVAADLLHHGWNAVSDYKKAGNSKQLMDDKATLSSGTNNLLSALLFSSGIVFGVSALKYYASHRTSPLSDLSKALHRLKSALDLVASCLGDADALRALCIEIREAMGVTQPHSNGSDFVVDVDPIAAPCQVSAPHGPLMVSNLATEPAPATQPAGRPRPRPAFRHSLLQTQATL